MKVPEQSQRVGWVSSARQGLTALVRKGPRLVPEREREDCHRSRGGGLGTRVEETMHAWCHRVLTQWLKVWDCEKSSSNR